MSVQNVRKALERFLKSDEAQVLCIRGTWGTGKTHTFNEVLGDLAGKHLTGLKKYAKVTLCSHGRFQMA
ncbi:hypothetical protein RlegWSM1455_06375 [Rhizobium laguerreae]|uniref:hypothetical protein n=1 Tax=Rhizobium laguerreae TaxID=1076926 RepID=UPI001E4CEC41|nr:hypothetical protein [Rhizobium laguerreae]UFW65648.1 hypothetical protein RlegWSM1455_06375 [Rhizobium laguerreae]